MEISQRGLALIKRFEGCRLEAYRDVGGVWTIGWGHTGPEVHDGLRWTQEQADAMLLMDIARRAAGPIDHLVTIPLTQWQFDALVSFTYNVGAGHLMHSTLLKCVNASDFPRAKLEFCEWDKVNGKVIAGLFLRRTAEAVLFGG